MDAIGRRAASWLPSGRAVLSAAVAALGLALSAQILLSGARWIAVLAGSSAAADLEAIQNTVNERWAIPLLLAFSCAYVGCLRSKQVPVESPDKGEIAPQLARDPGVVRRIVKSVMPGVLLWLPALLSRLGRPLGKLAVHGWRSSYKAAAPGAIWGWLAGAALVLVLLPDEADFSPGEAGFVLRRMEWARTPRVATVALLDALKAGDPDEIADVLRSGAREGRFSVVTAKDSRSACPALGDQKSIGLLRKALSQNSITLHFAQVDSFDALAEAGKCQWRLGGFPFDLVLAGDEPTRRKAASQVPGAFRAAVESGQPALLALAVKEGARLDEADWKHRGPLHMVLDETGIVRERAIARGDAQAAEKEAAMAGMLAPLLPHSGPLDARDGAGRTLAYLAVRADSRHVVPALVAVVGSNAVTASGATLMHAAAASGSTEMLDYVRGLGVPVDARTFDGMTPLHFATGAAVLRLLAWGADPASVDARGQLPLHAAVIRGDTAASELLARYTAARRQRDAFGKTAFDWLPPVPPKPSDGKAPRDLWEPLRMQAFED